MLIQFAHEYLKEVQDSITRAKSVDQIIKQLHRFSSCFGITPHSTDRESFDPKCTDRRNLMIKSAEESNVSKVQLKQLFYRELFPAFADTLLSVVTSFAHAEISSDWLPSFPPQERLDLFHSFFAQAPADVLLAVLVTHLSLVQPVSSDPHAAQAPLTVQAPGADTAAAILAERFALPESSGIEELSLACTRRGLETPHDGGGSSAELASLLVSIPDRAVSSSLKALQPAAFATQAVEHCSVAAGRRAAAPPRSQALDGSSKAAVAPLSHDSSFEAAVLTRLARRGHASLIAQALWKTIHGAPAPRLAKPGCMTQAECRSSREGRPASPEDSTEKSMDNAALSDRQASHAEATTSHDSHTANFTASRGHQSKKGIATISSQLPPEAQDGGTVEPEQPMTATPMEHGEALRNIRQLLWQVTDSQALQKILAALLLGAPVSDPHTAAQVLKDLLKGSLWQRQDVRYLFEGKLLLRRCVAPSQLCILVDILARLPAGGAGQSSLQHASVQLAQAWGSEGSIQQLPVQQQAYMTAALIQCLQLLGREQLEGTPGLFPALLTGVSTRLDSPEGPLRKQGMRVGKAFSAVLDPSKPALFSDLGDTELTAAEAWHPSCVTAIRLTAPTQKGGAPLPSEQEQGNQGPDAGYDSDMSLEAYDLSEGPNTEDFEQEGRPLQLRDAAALLRKGDDPQAVLKGLRAIGPLIEAAPEELSHSAGEVARALLYARPPEWADKEAATVEQKASTQRFSALAAVCEAAPQEGGLALAKEVYSPHLDMHQRLTILDALSTAARQLSSALPAPSPPSKEQLPQPDAPPGTREVGRSRRWAPKSLAKQQEGASRTRRNRFVGVAAQWTAALLDQVDQERQGVDLFGRDALILGHVLSCLGTFVECASPAQVTLWLASVVLELVAASEVHSHSQAFVRRSALIAASQVMRALPAAGLAGLLAGGQVSEGVLAERLEWCRGWTQVVAAQDADPQCQMLAAGCQSLQAKLAQEAMQALELGADSEPALTGHSSRDLIIPKGL